MDRNGLWALQWSRLIAKLLGDGTLHFSKQKCVLLLVPVICWHFVADQAACTFEMSES